MSHKLEKNIPSAAAYKVPLMKSTFLAEEPIKAALADFILKATKLSMGKQCARFEKSFAEKQGRKDAILFNSGGSANLAMIQALKNLGRLKDGDKVGFSALTWSTNVMPILQLGLAAVPIDCDPRTLNSMSKEAIPALKKEGCKAFFITNALGFAGDLEAIQASCAKEGIILIEDNCEALGTELKGGKTGNFGLASSFSFFVAHHMSTIEGGMVCTDDQEYAEMLRIVRANGWDRNLEPDQQKRLRAEHGVESEFESKYTFYDLGFNLRPTEITGFLGLAQIPLLDDSIQSREKGYAAVYEEASRNDDLLPLDRSHIKTLSAFALPFVARTPELRKKYVERFASRGIEVRPMIAGNMQRQPFYKKYIKREYSLPGADIPHHNGFYCGNCPDYTAEELAIIIDCIKK